jgi:hypothetical protein
MTQFPSAMENIFLPPGNLLKITISILFLKHSAGACKEKCKFYHPARVEALVGHYKISFVLNVAVSEAGIRIIKGEYRNLKKLNDEFSLSFLPQVYGFGETTIAGKRKISMFLGEWFDGFREFHVSRDPSDNTDKILVWDGPSRRYFLSSQQQAEIYRQAARILAYYYNVETFEQIFPWHHASGDFIIRIENAVPELKLISVRRYDSLFRDLNPQKNRAQDTELIYLGGPPGGS